MGIEPVVLALGGRDAWYGDMFWTSDGCENSSADEAIDEWLDPWRRGAHGVCGMGEVVNGIVCTEWGGAGAGAGADACGCGCDGECNGEYDCGGSSNGCTDCGDG